MGFLGPEREYGPGQAKPMFQILRSGAQPNEYQVGLWARVTSSGLKRRPEFGAQDLNVFYNPKI